MPRTVAPNPWKRLHQQLPEVEVLYRWLRPALMGYTRWPEGGPPYIVIANGLPAVEERMAVTHETQHVMRGKPTPQQKRSDERIVRRETAAWLLPDADAVSAMMLRRPLAKAASGLWVTVDVLLDRLRGMNAGELDRFH